MEKLSLRKKEVKQLYRKVFSLVKKKSGKFFKLKKLRGVMGWCEWEDGIKIDYRKEFIPTLIHECIHYLKPEWSESKVLYAEKRIVNYLTARQVIKLLKVFVCNM